MQSKKQSGSKPPQSGSLNGKQDKPSVKPSPSSKGQSVPPKRDSFQQAAVRQVLVSNGNGAGDGLWCYQKENTNIAQSGTFQFKQQQLDPEVIKRSEKIVSQKTDAFNHQLESEMIELLEKQCGDLGLQLENQVVQLSNQNIQMLQQQQNIQQLNEKISVQNSEIQNLRSLRNNLESQIESIKDLYNKAKREISGLQVALQNEQQMHKELAFRNNELKQENNGFQVTLQSESEALRERLEELEEENDELKNRLQIRGEIEKRVDAEKGYRQLNETKLNQVRDKEHKLEKMGKLLEDNASLSEKLAESEILRKKFMEKSQLLEKDLKVLLEEKNEFMKQIGSQKKRINDLSILKSTNNKILEDRIHKLQEQCDKLQKENQKFKKYVDKFKAKQKQQVDSEEEEQIEEVQAKPQLFGS